ncbi:hypothetical protein B0H63DRAFT_159136 [Podospora didyma]|uniref:Uncharacterized protein n=1 Tax=Podospora didyma TaxID=330526 RepID=A0AAE0NU69_9PEZI|nr:hypothetical protein B0H63DRAFT_159136 [Podospora didyma]
MGYIHTCSLRWSLQREGRIDFNSNLRLFTASKYNASNEMIANTSYLISIALAYGSTSLIFLTYDSSLSKALYDSGELAKSTVIYLNPITLFTFGGGLFIQASITTWALLTTDILTWSSNPLNVARACVVNEYDGHRVEPRAGRCMMSVHLTKKDARAYRPVPKQQSMLTAHSRVKTIIFFQCSLPFLSGIWGVTLLLLTKLGHYSTVPETSWAFIPWFPSYEDHSNCIGPPCTDGTAVVNIDWSSPDGVAGIQSVYLIIGTQTPVTVSPALRIARRESISRRGDRSRAHRTKGNKLPL